MRLRDAVLEKVGPGTAPGAVMAVSRKGQVWLEAVGSGFAGGEQPMQTDAVMRISSMTKPVAAVVTMMLAEHGILALDDPITRWLPELADRQVVRRLDGGPPGATRPPSRCWASCSRAPPVSRFLS